MRFLPFLLFIAVPLVELTLLIKVGEIIGIGATILLVVSTAVIGVSLLKRQGLAAMARARETVEAGEFPIESVVDGACLLVAGAFLITPGLLTDTVGFSLLIPALRRSLARWLFNKLTSSGQLHPGGFGAGPGGAPQQDDAAHPQGPVIEVEYEDIDAPGPESPKDTGKSTNGKSSPWRK
jgi:UPF0716 protein FxsA